MKLLYVVAKAEYFLSHRLSLARYAQNIGFNVAVATTPFQEKDYHKITGMDTFLVRFRRGGINPFIELKTISDLLTVFKKFRPAIVHNVALKPALYSTALARFYRIPSVNAINGFGYIFTSNQIKARLLRPFVKLALKLILNHSSVKVIVQNQDDFQDCKNLLPKCDLYLIPGSGVDTHSFYPIAKQGIFTFTLVARMLWSKGVREFVEAARGFIEDNPLAKIRFLLVGAPDAENPESISLSALEEWNREGVVEWLGCIDDMQSIYAQTHVAVLPSYREGLPKSLLEAMACGLPIITTDATGCRDIVHDDNGLRVPVKSIRELQKAFKKCFDDEQACKRMGQRGRERVEKKYCARIINLKIVNIYNKILQ